MIPNVSYVQNQKTGLGVKIIRVRSTGDRLHCRGALEKLKKLIRDETNLNVKSVEKNGQKKNSYSSQVLSCA